MGKDDLVVDLTGEATVWRSDTYESDPSSDPGHNNRIDLEIVSMTLTADGLSLRAGDGVGNGTADNAISCLGSSQEVPEDPALADDIFEIFFEVEFGGATLTNNVPLVVESRITQLPPLGSEFEQTGPLVPLVGANDADTDFAIVSVSFTPLVRIDREP